ncbi:hypothetical protein FQN54_008586 [Arachnomyces sp. PD_36]|nr:hypothetical protein FQN54_008586 [Arachnomyces sp. PD_36]
MPSPDDFQQESDNFLSWLTQRPGVAVNPKIYIADLRAQGAGRGVVAQQDISEDEILFTIPRDVLLSVQNSKLRDQLPTNLDELGPWLSLMLVMIYEYLQGEASRWHPYFQALPSTFDTLMFWSEPELSELQASAVIDKIGKQGAESSIRETIMPIVRANPSLFPPSLGTPSYDGPEGEEALLKLAHRMGSLIMAYAFDVENQDDDETGEDGYVTDDEQEISQAMVPLADFLNADAHRNNARLFQEEDSFSMKSTKPIQKGEEIFNDYGELPRSDLLRRYGYITDNYSQYDVVELPLETICHVAGLQSAKPGADTPPLQLMDELDLLDDGYNISKPTAGDSLPDVVPDELLSLIQALHLSPEQLAQAQKKQKPPKPTFDLTAAKFLLQVTQKRQTQYATSVAEDDNILNQLAHKQQECTREEFDTKFRRLAMAVAVRKGEKEILNQFSTGLERRIAENQEDTVMGDSNPKRSAQAEDGTESNAKRSRKQ